MKKLMAFPQILLIAAFISACGTESKDKKSELADLKKQRDELNQQIASLEKELVEENPETTFGKATLVEVEKVSTTSFQSFVDIQGFVDAQDNVTISPTSQGPITAIYARVGQRVTKGTVLAEQENGPIKQQINAIEPQYQLAKTVFEKQKDLWDQKIGSEIQYLNAKTQKEALEKQIVALKEQLELTKFKSPINGVVDAMDVKIGQIPNPMNSGIRVVNFSSLKVKASVGEAFAARVKEGAPAIVIIPDLKDTLKTKVTHVADVIDPINRSFNVEAVLPNVTSLKPNMVAVFKINDYSSTNAIVVPITTVQNLEEGDFVFIAENKRAKKVKVQVGRIYNGKAQIISGLKVGDQLVTSGYQELVDGQALNF